MAEVHARLGEWSRQWSRRSGAQCVCGMAVVWQSEVIAVACLCCVNVCGDGRDGVCCK